jgi:broad specificity phosphatase PhoE
MDVLLIRHGHSLLNHKERHQQFTRKEYNHLLRRSSASPLTRKGVEQCKDLARNMQSVPVARLFTSPLRRARQMAHILGAAWHRQPHVCEDLRELNLAPLPERRTGKAPFWWFMLQSYLRMVHPPRGQESWLAGFRRAYRVWGELRRQPDGPTAVISHGRFISLLLMLAHLLPGLRVQRQQTDKAGVSRVSSTPFAPARQQRGASRPASIAG